MEKLRPRVDLNPLTLSPPCDRIKIREEPTITLSSSFLSSPQFEGKNRIPSNLATQLVSGIKLSNVRKDFNF